MVMARDPTPRTWDAAAQLPESLSSFVGREEELAGITKVATRHRLVTLIGPGGVGKTRLAIEVARLLGPGFGAGVHFLELSGVPDGDLVDESVLAGLGLRADAQQAPREVVTAHLRGLNALLVLDNCEHVIEASAALVDHLVTRCGQLHVLATSREPLQVRGERVLQVAPLQLPDAGRPVRPDALRHHSALQLFAERAEAAGGPFHIRPQDVGVVAQICRRLDGLPLALELAAARMRAMSPEALLAELANHERLRVLTAGSRTVEDRHRTLRATMEWSYRLLAEPERLLFARLSVFAGGFDLAAADHVAGHPPIAPADVLELLSGLVDRSLVTAVAGPPGALPYRMLDTLRAFGRERLLEAGEHEVTQRRHAEHYAELLAKPALTWTRAALGEVRDQLDDVRAALAWSCAHEPELVTLICGRLVGFWGRHGQLGEGCQWMDRIIDRLPADDSHRVVAVANASWLAQRHGTFDVAERHALEELRVARQIGDASATADALTRVGDVARNRDDPETAIRYAEQGAAMRRREEDPYELALALMVLGSARGRHGDFEAGRANLDEAALLFVSIPEPSGVALCQGWLGELSLREGALGRATEQLSASLRAFRDLQDAWMVANLFDLLAWLAGVEKEPIRVLRLAGAAGSVRDAIGAGQLPALAGPLAPIVQSARRWVRSRADLLVRQGAGAELDQAVAYALRDVEWALPERTAGQAEGMSRRELQVALLVAQGLADKEIAARLGISVRTAEHHVGQLRRKLGCSSRTQIATWVVEHDLKPQR
jgi:predicted ATPase/DNA-binding CsgD family transcriptional regulator